jgi:cysteine desulfurase / selenocysteine lyase
MKLLEPQNLKMDELRKDFPIFDRIINGKRLVYLDNSATTQKPKRVINKILNYYENYNANVHRGVYKISEESTSAFEGAHQKVANFINASFEEIIFTKGATEGINLVAYSLMDQLKKGDEIVISLMEHHSNFVPWQQIAKKTGAVLRFIDVNKDYRLSEDFPINSKTKVVAVTHMSNVLGTINPVKEICKISHENDALFLVDAAQSAPHMKLDMKDLKADFVAFSSHKMLGPTGVGVLYGKKEILETLDPFNYGGDMIREVYKEKSRWNDLPWKFEAGTPNIAGAIGLGEAVDYLDEIGMKNIQNHEKKLTVYALKRLSEVKGLELCGPNTPRERGPVFSFNLQDVHAHDVCSILDNFGVAIRGGHHCAMPLMKKFGWSNTSRASCYFYNSPADIDKLIEGLKEVIEKFKR